MVLSITDDGRVAATTYSDQLKINKLTLFLDKHALSKRVPLSQNIKPTSKQAK